MYLFSIHSEKKSRSYHYNSCLQGYSTVHYKTAIYYDALYVYPANLKGEYRIAWYPAITVIEKWIFILSTKEVDSILLN